jgi:hypothetical protein
MGYMETATNIWIVILILNLYKTFLGPKVTHPREKLRRFNWLLGSGDLYNKKLRKKVSNY